MMRPLTSFACISLQINHNQVLGHNATYVIKKIVQAVLRPLILPIQTQEVEAELSLEMKMQRREQQFNNPSTTH